MQTLRIQAGYRCDIGHYRENNEDRVFADPNIGLFMVADGMGGQAAGETASQMAIYIIPQRLALRLGSQPNGDKAVAEVIRLAVLDANQEIIDSATRHPEFQSMGTTLVLALVRAGSVFIAGI